VVAGDGHAAPDARAHRRGRPRVDEELAGVDLAAMVAERDALLIDLLAAKAEAAHLP
jgi:hypothetical protein